MTICDLVTLCNLVRVFAETKSVIKSRLHCTKLNSNLIYLTKSWKKTVQNHSSNWFTVRFLDKCSKIEVFLALKSRIHHRNRHYNLSGLRLLVKPNWTLDEGCIAFIPANLTILIVSTWVYFNQIYKFASVTVDTFTTVTFFDKLSISINYQHKEFKNLPVNVSEVIFCLASRIPIALS